MLTLTTLAAGPALAGDLDNQVAEVRTGDPVEAWTLINGSRLGVDGGQTLQIVADDSSELNIWDAVVTRSGTSQRAITLNDSAYLALARTQVHGGIGLHGGTTQAVLAQSSIAVTTA
ncbi:hypothetical protein, partial [Enterobacter cloacae]|uniref:hypothetical protein n=1 Tax=Enterobacter cloacae TaxID=550 RepID=UPI0034E4B038